MSLQTLPRRHTNGVRGLGGLGIVGVSDLISQDLVSWVNYPGGGGTPEAFAYAVSSDAAGYCRNWDCSGIDIASLVSAAVAQYTKWYNGQPIVSPLPLYPTQPPIQQYVPPPPNALTVVAPTPVYVAPQPTQNYLTPPTQNPYSVNPNTIVNNQSPAPAAADTTQQTTVVNAPTASDQAIVWLKDNWILVAAGIGAAIILPSILSRN